MAGIYGNSAEDRARERELNQYLDKQDAAENRQIAIDELIAFNTNEALNDQKVFDTLDDDYEVIDRGQVMRALRSLDAAIKYAAHGNPYFGEGRPELDAVFTALSNIQKNFTEAVKHEAETEYERNL